MKRFIILMFASIAVMFATEQTALAKQKSAQDITDQALENTLKELDRAIAHRPELRKARQELIDSLKREAVNAPTAARFDSLATLYIQVNNDSVLHYYKWAIDLAEGTQKQVLMAKYAAQMPVSGFVESAGHQFEAVDTTGFSRREFYDYYDAGRRMYIYMTSFFSNYPDTAIIWSKKATECQSKILDILTDETDVNAYRVVHGEFLLRSGRSDLAEITLRDVYETEPEDSPLRSRAAHVLSHIAAQHGEHNAKLDYLAASVLTELKSGVVELSSLQDLGMQLNAIGDDERAFRYLNVALNDATDASSMIKQVQAASMVPIVQAAHVQSLENGRHALGWVVAALAVVLILLAVSIFFQRRDMIRLKSARSNLTVANRTKELYMAQFLQLCSVYMERLTNFTNLVKRKITAGKVEDIAKMVKSGKFLDEQTSEFFAVFDDAFLHIYPTFVEDVNRLLRDDSQIILKEDERMNTDLRILAFMRMGIEDASRIAQILNYSVNTIYAYRNKLKTKAINRETFEQDIMKIDAVN